MIADDRYREARRIVGERSRATFEDLAAARRAAVVAWRCAEWSPHRPEPWLNERAQREAAWLDDERDEEHGYWIGFDAEGLVAIAEHRWAETIGVRPDEVWLHGDGWSDRITDDSASRLLLDANGRLTAVVGLEFGRPYVEAWTWDGDVPVRGDIAIVGPGHTVSETYVAEVDDRGGVGRLSRGVDVRSPRGPGDDEALLAEALDRASGLTPDHVVFDARLHRVERRLRDGDELVALLGAAFERAIVAAVAASGIESPLVAVAVLPQYEFPPHVHVGAAAFTKRIFRRAATAGHLFMLLREAEPPNAVTLSLLDFLDEEALRACRELNWARGQARRDPALAQRAYELGPLLAADLAVRSNTPTPGQHANEFVVFARFTDEHEDPAMLAPLAARLGEVAPSPAEQAASAAALQFGNGYFDVPIQNPNSAAYGR
jgi:hypothetical protein